MKSFVARFARDESGATAIDYGLIAALIAVALIGAAQIGTTLHTVGTEIQNSGGGTP